MSDKICDFRLEAEYYSKIYEKLGVNLTKNHLVELSTLVKSKIITGHTPSMKNEKFYGGKISFIKTDNLRDNFIKEPFSDYLSELGDEKIKNSRLKEFDIITTIIGATYKIIGRSCLVNSTMLPSNINQNIALIRADIKKINPYYLNVYMQSLYGKLYLHWLSRQTEQVNLNCEEVGKLKVARFSNPFEESLATLNKKSYGLNIISNEKYSKAEKLLLSELGLENFNPSSEKVSIKTLKESFLKTGRLDSEYYQPKYDEIEKKLDKIGVEKLENICSLINYGTVPTSPYVKSNSSIPYIKGMNLKNCFVVGDLDGIENTDTLQDKFFTKENDIIISQMGTVGDVGIITKEQENYLFASFTIRARLDDDRFNPFFVGAYIQNVAKEYYLYRNIAQASVRQNTDLPTIKNMPIPLVKKEVQDEIADYIKQSMEYSKKAKELLEIATKSVEIAIDKDETAAHNFLEQNRR